MSKERRMSHFEGVWLEKREPDYNAIEKRRQLSTVEIEERVREGSVPQVSGGLEALEIAKEGGWEIDAFITQMEMEDKQTPKTRKWTEIETSFANPKYFTILLVSFASMGGLLSGLDQSLISGANLYMPKSLHLTTDQLSLVNSGMPLGAVAGALLLSPANEYLGRRMSILVACVLYTIGAGLEAGARSYGMMVAGRLVLGAGVGLEGGTVPVYVAETVERRQRGNLVSLYQFNIALGEVFGYVVAAIFLHVKGNWRFILGSSLVFSTIMFGGFVSLTYRSPEASANEHPACCSYLRAHVS